MYVCCHLQIGEQTMWFLRFVTWTALLLILSYQLMLNVAGPIALDDNNRPVVVAFGVAFDASAPDDWSDNQREGGLTNIVPRLQNFRLALQNHNLLQNFEIRFILLFIIALVTSIQSIRFDLSRIKARYEFHWFGNGMLWWFGLTLLSTVACVVYDNHSTGAYYGNVRQVLFSRF